MVTRHLTCVVKDGDYKVAQYGQWDGYPSGQGSDILLFLRNKFDREKFFANLDQTFTPTYEQVKAWWLEFWHDLDKSDGFVDSNIASQYGDKHPSLCRDTGGKILQLIQNASEPVPLNLHKEFAADSLFCEWAYVVDFDKGTFEVFKGFNRLPLTETERFYGLECDDVTAGYFPVRLIKAYHLDALPTTLEFMDDLEPQDEEEE